MIKDKFVEECERKLVLLKSMEKLIWAYQWVCGEGAGLGEGGFSDVCKGIDLGNRLHDR